MGTLGVTNKMFIVEDRVTSMRSVPGGAGGTQHSAGERRLRDVGAPFAEERKSREADETETRLGDYSTE